MRIAAIAIATAGLLVAAVPSLAADRPADARGEAELAKVLGDRVAGKPVSCINLTMIGQSQIIDKTAILYHGRNGTIYVNRPKDGAEVLESDQILRTRTHDTQLCNIDVVHLIDRGSQFESGFVNLDDFVPYGRKPG